MEKSREKRMALRHTAAYRNTNRTWNHLHLNAGWCIGHMMKIIGEHEFDTFEDWEKFYFETSRTRQELLKKESDEVRVRLQNLCSVHDDFIGYREGLTQAQVDINEGHGRTMEELHEIAGYLYKGVVDSGNPFGITKDDCVTFTYIRVVDEIFIGMEREKNTAETLRARYPHLIFVKASPYYDRVYAIDLEVYDKKRNLLCALQIKSPGYKKNETSILNETKNYNHDKNEKYQALHHVPVFYVYSTVEGEIEDSEIFTQMNSIA